MRSKASTQVGAFFNARPLRASSEPQKRKTAEEDPRPFETLRGETYMRRSSEKNVLATAL